MRNSDFNKFGRLLTWVGMLYEKDLTGTVGQLYWETLKPYPLEDIYSAAEEHLVNPDRGYRLPMPADFIFYIEGSPLMRAQFHWYAVEEAIKKGPLISPKLFEDEISFAIVDEEISFAIVGEMGGWEALSILYENSPKVVKSEFVNRYRERLKFLLHKPDLQKIIECQPKASSPLEPSDPIDIVPPAKPRPPKMKRHTSTKWKKIKHTVTPKFKTQIFKKPEEPKVFFNPLTSSSSSEGNDKVGDLEFILNNDCSYN